MPANGEDAFAPVGGTLIELLRGAGLREGREALATPRVRRSCKGRFVPVECWRGRTEIPGFAPIGGEQIT